MYSSPYNRFWIQLKEYMADKDFSAIDKRAIRPFA
jgi:hypothetical protein